MPTKAELIAENERLWSLLRSLTAAHAALVQAQQSQSVYGQPGNAKTYFHQPATRGGKTAAARRANAAAFGFSGGKWNPENAVLDLQALANRRY